MTKTQIDIMQMMILTGKATIIKSKVNQENAYWEFRKAGLIDTLTDNEYLRVIKIKNHNHEWN